ncbi:MAG TPA: AAA family ATPase [Chloroflexota bacterium]
MARTVAIANQKGGVGKTTTCLNLGAALAARGYRVLLVDLDPQGSLTSAAGIEPNELADTVYSAMMHYLQENEAPDLGGYLHAIGPSLDILPANIELSVAEVELQNAIRREYVLAEVLDPVADRYDVVLVDCPPSLSLLTVNALTAADEVLIPVVPEYLAARGLGLLLNMIQRVRKSRLNPRLAIAGVLLTMVDQRTSHGQEVVRSIRAHLDGLAPILGEVKRTVKVSEASAAGVPLLRYAARSDSAQAYDRVADALVQRWALGASVGIREDVHAAR